MGYCDFIQGLAYVDFSDDAHLEAAVAKNKQKLLGQKLSIARSDPKKSQKRGSFGSSNARGRGMFFIGSTTALTCIGALMVKIP